MVSTNAQSNFQEIILKENHDQENKARSWVED
jgi:hypothetical protein